MDQRYVIQTDPMDRIVKNPTEIRSKSKSDKIKWIRIWIW